MKKIETVVFLLFNILIIESQICFTPRTQLSDGMDAVFIVNNDFNNDGKKDLAMANWWSFNVTIKLGNGDGSFSPAAYYNVGDNPSDITAADFNGDGKLDLAVTNSASHNVSLLIATGNGSFATAVNYTVGNGIESPYPVSITSADFNGDGKLDIATANKNSKDISVLLGNGVGSFGAANTFTNWTTPGLIISADFNNDGKVDLATGNTYNQSVSIYLGTGTGSFSAQTDFTTVIGNGQFTSLITSDFNSDGKTDLAMGNSNSLFKIPVMLGTGTGSFAPAFYLSNVNQGTPYSVSGADYNGDSFIDICSSNQYTKNYSIFLGNGIGGFGAAINIDYGNLGVPLKVTSADFNGDSRMDLAMIDGNDGACSIILNCYGVGLSEYTKDDQFLIYPNPASANVFIETLSTETGYMELYDISGRLIMTQNLIDKTSIEIGELKNGLYFVVLFDENKNKLGTKKVVVQH